MKTNILIALSFVLVLSISAQKKKFTMEEAVMGYYKGLYPESISHLKWIPNTNKYCFAEGKSIMIQGLKGKSKELFNLSDLNGEFKSKDIKKLSYIPSFSFLNKNLIKFRVHKRVVVFNIATKKIESEITYTKKDSGLEYCHENGYIAYTRENGLYIKKNNELTVAEDEDKNIVYGQTVSRSEFGIRDGIFWSPKGSYLAFYRKDESRVTNYPIVNVDKRVAEVENTKYPMAGMDSEYITLGVYNLSSKNTVYLKTNPETEEYLTNISWDPNEKFIYIQVLNRAQNHMKLNKYDVTTGEFVKTLFEEKHDKYVEPEHTLTFLKNSPGKFIYQTDKDGYNHVYLYKTDGRLIKQLTKGEWVVTSVKGFDAKERNMYFVATKDGVLNRNLYKVSLKSGKILRLTTGEGTHSVSLSSDKKYFTDNFSNIETPRKISIYDTKGKFKKELLEAKNPVSDYEMGDIKLFTVKSLDNSVDLNCRMITPANMDKNKKYPVILYVYGGPHSQLIQNRWLGGGRLWYHLLAQKGYIVFTVDNRGTNNRGRDFENIIHRQCGQIEMKDQIAGINYLKTLPYVDANRIGVQGWSYGGFMATSLMVNYPDVFKVGVAGGPVIDWKYYEVMYGERYMDTPQENPEGYKKTSLIGRAKDLKGRMLIIHGAIDPTVVWQHSLKFVRDCVKEGKLIDYFPYPRHEHNVMGNDRIHLRNKITQYFDDFL